MTSSVYIKKHQWRDCAQTHGSSSCNFRGDGGVLGQKQYRYGQPRVLTLLTSTMRSCVWSTLSLCLLAKLCKEKKTFVNDFREKEETLSVFKFQTMSQISALA